MKSISNALLSKGVSSLSDLLIFVKKIPYGRNSSRTDFSLILSENRGTCSTKHAFVKTFALENGLDEVQLIMGIFKMNGINTPQIATVLNDSPLDYIPEAHVYLKIENKYFDLTTMDSDFSKIKDYILEEMEIQPEHVGTFKVDYHKIFLRKWIVEEGIDLGFEEVWKVRELCIWALSQ